MLNGAKDIIVYIFLVLIILVTHFYSTPVIAKELFEKVIWINQPKQVGWAYERGKKFLEFSVLTGDDETFPSDPGTYIVEMKDNDYYSHKYKTPMRYSLFFDLKQKKAIHEGNVPHTPKDKKELRTRGCIHVELPYIKQLYDWAEEGNTVVIIQGWRTKN